MNLNPKRLSDESFDDYKKRRLVINKLTKRYLKGKLVKNTREELFKIRAEQNLNKGIR